MFKNKSKELFKNLFVLFFSFMICFLFFEFIIINFIFRVSDLPSNLFVQGIIKYRPKQQGKKFIDDYMFHYKINSQGWNSKYQQYSIKKTEKFRIAIIGDSYVEGFAVDFDKSLAEQLEIQLGYEDFEVYRFAIGGAPLSQYLHILREEVNRYNPDLVIIVIAHNDFWESYEMKPGRYNSSFLKLELVEGQNIKEITPVSYKESWWEYISRKSAMLRFLRTRFRLQLREILGHYLLSDLRQAKPVQYHANINMRPLQKT